MEDLQLTRRNLLAVMGVTAGSAMLWRMTPSWAAEAGSSLKWKEVSGVYPHLAYYNMEGECGTGAVVLFADRLWVITYGPHKPWGSTDKLYEITPDLKITARPESIGGTPADRMIHRESNQLFIGPYAIDAERNVRVIKPGVMPGRLTGAARHLTDPAGKIYFATMEEGFYEVDVKSLDVKMLYQDGNMAKDGNMAGALLPGYHGKGLYSGQGRLVYANNGERSQLAERKPDIPSGVLAEWDGTDWKVIRRNQFTEVTGPGGIYGNPKPETDPIWSLGWDHRSVILMLREGGTWTPFRLPKASHSYDGAHGWNTEWPRIRDVGTEGKPDLLMTMHGMFWRFPKTFSLADTGGIRPRSSYLKVIGDFTRYGDRIVLGCDDSAKAEFLNNRKLKGKIAGPEQSNSNLWFVQPETLDQLGPIDAAGAVWLKDAVKAGEVSDPFLIGGWPRFSVNLVNGGKEQVEVLVEVRGGKGGWTRLDSVPVNGGLSSSLQGKAVANWEWIRFTAKGDCPELTVQISLNTPEKRSAKADAIFNGLAVLGDGVHPGGLVRSLGKSRTMALAAQSLRGAEVTSVGGYELTSELELVPSSNANLATTTATEVAIPKDVVAVEESSVLVVDNDNRRWRLPLGNEDWKEFIDQGTVRLCREVATERDLLNCHGTFYELPAENADGFAKVRPIASHNLHITDYCSYRGMLVMTGIQANSEANPRIIRSADGKAAVWVGVIDDLWKLGKPTGRGGPWKNEFVQARKPSDPYLFKGYDKRTLELSHDSANELPMDVELDVTGTGVWFRYKQFVVPAGKVFKHEFPEGTPGRWLRVSSSVTCNATAWLTYS